MRVSANRRETKELLLYRLRAFCDERNYWVLMQDSASSSQGGSTLHPITVEPEITMWAEIFGFSKSLRITTPGSALLATRSRGDCDFAG